MNVTLAKTAGFCYGVNRAVNMVEELVQNGEKVCTLGPIIHNTQMVNKLAEDGVRIVNTPEEANENETLVIRSHGVPKEVVLRAEKLCKKTVDATCPFVSKIHKIVDNEEIVLIAGDS